MKLSANSKRLGVFIFFDRDSIIDDYVIYMLDSLNEAVDNILFISNSELSDTELKKLDKYNIDINIRENKGLDAGAFKYAYDKYGKEYFSNYDEVILLNDTFFGPFRPFKEIINSMNDKDLDFWGLTANYDSEDGTGKAIDNYIHTHIQTFFVAYRKTVLESNFFNNYWNKYNINKNNSFVDVVNNHESYFTYLLEKEGFKWDTYVNLDHYKNDNKEYNYNIYGYSAYTLISYYGCPFIKRKNFVFDRTDALYMNDGLDTIRALEYIKNNTDYDINMIYKNVVRLYKPFDLYKGMGLNYITKPSSKSNGNKLIIAEITDEKSYEISKRYFDNIKDSKVVLVTEDKALSEKINVDYNENIFKYLLSERENIINKYDYVCLLTLKDDIDNFQEVIDSNNIRILDNSIASDEYINGITDILEENMMDVLFLPESVHNKNVMNLSGRYKYKVIKEVDKKNNTDLELNNFNKLPYGVWLKSKSLNNIDNLDITFNELIAIYELLDNKSLFGKVYNDKYMKQDILNLETIFNTVFFSGKLELSFPNKMLYANSANPFRNMIRLLVPFKVRKVVKKIFRMK